MTDPIIEKKMRALRASLQAMGRVLVAFSGGVDSTFLLKAALDALGSAHVRAVIGESPSFPAREREEAVRLAESLGARYERIRCDELADPRYAANPSNRCYYCKSDLFARLTALAAADGSVVVDGANADDRADWRPGSQAACELGVRSPLMEGGITKAEIRELSRALGLPTWNKPSYACLASRIPYGTPISAETLAAVEAAEEALREFGFLQVRVRHHGEVARIEVPPEEVSRVADPALRDAVTARLRAVGYRYVTLDLQGYRTGSMNEVL